MNSINISGNLIKDAELRATNSGDNVLTFAIADNQGANKDAIFWNCSLFWQTRIVFATIPFQRPKRDCYRLTGTTQVPRQDRSRENSF